MLLLQTAPLTNATASKPTTAPTPNTNHANTPFFLSPHPYTCVEAKAVGFTVRRTQLASSFDNIRSRTTHYSPDNLPLHLYSIPLAVLYSSFSPPPPSAPRNNPPRRLAETRSRDISFTPSPDCSRAFETSPYRLVYRILPLSFHPRQPNVCVFSHLISASPPWGPCSANCPPTPSAHLDSPLPHRPLL